MSVVSNSHDGLPACCNSRAIAETFSPWSAGIERDVAATSVLLTIIFSNLADPAIVKATQNARTYSASKCSGLCVSGDDPSTATTLARQAALISSNSINRQTRLRSASLALAPASTARLTQRQPCRQYERWRKESYRGDPVGFDVRQAEQCRSIYKPFGI